MRVSPQGRVPASFVAQQQRAPAGLTLQRRSRAPPRPRGAGAVGVAACLHAHVRTPDGYVKAYVESCVKTKEQARSESLHSRAATAAWVRAWKCDLLVRSEWPAPARR